MAAKITGVAPDSLGEELELKPGDVLLQMNGQPVRDVIDYMYYEATSELSLLVEIDGEEVLFEIEKEPEEPLGLDFEDYLMDRQRSCKNKCIFCFIDQLPKGLRETLYFKDDDARMSFLMGNYITLTNLTEEDIDRIVQMRISPINISVHTTDPKLRVKMMANPNAAKINEILKKFYNAGIEMNCQIVLCKGVNDGEHLKKSLNDLADLAPYVRSTSVVPVGLSRHREGLYPLLPFEKEDAIEVIKTIEEIGDCQLQKYGVRGCYPSDEFYVLAEKAIPDEAFYDGYPQIENGVGLMRSLQVELEDCLAEEQGDDVKREVGIITGVLPADYMSELLKKVQSKFTGLSFEIYPIINHFFGEKITVSGLVTGTDIVAQLKGKKLPSRVLIPSSMLRAEQDMFLDSITLDEVSKELARPISVSMNDGADLLDKILGR
jgi:putative radical SAM enzyme (TIGR03279 family)